MVPLGTLRRAACLGLAAIVWLVCAAGVHAQQPAPVKRPNVLLIVADDMNADSPGCFGGTVPGITPHLDRLAAEGMRFEHAHVNVAVCTPSRSVMLTGLYPQHSGVEGFQPIRAGTPTLPSLLSEAGYLCGTIGKPLGQQETFRWSVAYRWQGTGDEDLWGRDPAVYRRFTRSFILMAQTAGQPFFLMANSHDPHRPFAASELEKRRLGKPHYERAEPSRIYRPDEVTTPGFLPDLPEVRQEAAEYATSVRRCDEMVGAVLDELRQSGAEADTIVLFLSDHGMPFPFAKSNCYLHSTRTPLIIRWPERVQPGAVDRTHLISTVDLLPTILEGVGVSPATLGSQLAAATSDGPTRWRPDGRSFLALLEGRPQSDRDQVFTQFNHIHARRPYPMRCVLTKRLAYIFNPWSDGSRIYQAAPLSGLTFRAMAEAAESDESIMRRVEHLRRRSVEELYDLTTDPDCRRNLIEEHDYQTQTDDMRAALRRQLVETGDPVLTAFDQRDSRAALERFMQEYTERAKREIEALSLYENATGYRF
ncbi:sulfatase family protein [Lignipirellula cremea]|uniref:Arylsulfatase n=1 Tax=Lignipirellula cremea TaxID=2528010 RepID=A0A518DQC6_9BACT|nr:sulfatase [Lignipirellula cremea]QDU94041.1 Arylsulfatase precursor [Lignipirellula cremea]